MPESLDPPSLTPELAVRWRLPSDPQISPDGETIAFVVSDIASADEHKRSSVWMVGRALSDARQFTFGTGQDVSPRWTPGGSRLVFLSDRAERGTLQLYSIDTGGGEAHLLASCLGGITTPKPSPDGRWIAFRGRDGQTDDEKEREKVRRDHVVAGADEKFQRLYVVAVQGGEPHPVSPDGRVHVVDFDWAPDSASLVAVTVANPRTNDEYYGPSRLVIFDRENVQPEEALLCLDAGIAQPSWAPDGTSIAYLGKAGRVQTEDALFTVPLAGGTPRSLTPHFNGSVAEFQWKPDASAIRFVGFEGLCGTLREVDVTSGNVSPLLPPDGPVCGTYSGLSFDRLGRRFAVVRTSADQPWEVWAGTVGHGIEQVSELNPELASLHFATPQCLEWSSSDGTPIAGLLYTPVCSDAHRPFPLVVEVHGGPAYWWSDRFAGNWHDWVQLLTARGFAVFLPNPRGSIGRGATFTDAEINDMGGMEWADILTGLDYVISLGSVDPDRVGIGGWSHGGYMSAWAITQTDRFKAAVVGAGVTNLISDQGQNDIPTFNRNYFDASMYEDSTLFWNRSPMAHVRNVKTPTLILHGEKDERVAVPQARELHAALRDLHVPVEFVVYPREGHAFIEREHQLDMMQRLVAWFERYVRDVQRD